MTDPILEFTVDPNEFHEMKVGDTVCSPLNATIWFGDTHPTVENFGSDWESRELQRGRLCVVLDRREKWLNLLTPVGVGWCRGKDFTRMKGETR
jgi:hypothetical protein